MTTCGWVTLVVGIIVIVVVITSFVKYPKVWCEYWREDWSKVKPCWNDGLILDIVKFLFWLLSKFSLLTIIQFCKRKIRQRYKYWIVDLYIVVFSLIELAILLTLVFNPTIDLSCNLLKAFIIYRLFDIFQVWIRHFILPDWNLISAYRSLILVFIGYLEIIIAYTLLVFILKDKFIGITCWQQALYYSVRNAITIGSDITPTGCCGYAIFYTQLMFVLLFLTSVISRIMSRRE